MWIRAMENVLMLNRIFVLVSIFVLVQSFPMDVETNPIAEEKQLSATYSSLRELLKRFYRVDRERTDRVYDGNPLMAGEDLFALREEQELLVNGSYGGLMNGDQDWSWIFGSTSNQRRSLDIKKDRKSEFDCEQKEYTFEKQSAYESNQTEQVMDEKRHGPGDVLEETDIVKKEIENGVPQTENRLPVVKFGPFGERPTYDTTAEQFSYASSNNMITAVKLYYLLYKNKKILRGVGFKTTLTDYPKPVFDQGTNEELVLQKDEYITEVKGMYNYLYIFFLQFTTNKGSSIAAGLTTAVTPFIVSNDGAPLLYAEGFMGLYIYEMKFTFYKHAVGSTTLNDEIKALSFKVYNTLKTDVKELGKVYMDHQWMFPDIQARFCFDYKLHQKQEAEISCNAEFIINQLNVLRMGVDSYKNHQPRQLTYSDSDTLLLLKDARDAKVFHTSMYELQLTISQAADITVELSKQLGAYFKSVAEFDKRIATKDVEFIESKLKILRAGYDATKSSLHSKFIKILKVATMARSADLAGKIAAFGLEMAASANPFNTDPAGVMDRLNEVAGAVEAFTETQVLFANLRTYIEKLESMKAKIDSNEQQEAAKQMEKIAYSYTSLSQDEKYEAADTFIQNYGAYSPAVGSEDLAEANALLSVVAEKACELAKGVDTGIAKTIAGTLIVGQECTYIFAELAKIAVIQEELYVFQFELVKAFTSMVQAGVVQTASTKISSISNQIDLTSAVMSMMMMEVSYQAAAQERCVTLEYIMGGKRTDDCEALIFTDFAIRNILIYTGATVPKSAESRDAYIPTAKEPDNTAYINLENLLSGGVESLELPRGEKGIEWLIRNKWLTEVDRTNYPEYSYYVKAFEAYLPNVKCENGEDADIIMEARTSKYTRLFMQEAAASYLRARTIYIFKYNDYDQAHCDDKEMFKAWSNDESRTSKEATELCMMSRGQQAGSTPEILPSLLSTWNLSIKKPESCKLVLKDPSWTPMVTLKLDLIIVQQTGINECFPTGTRCPSNQHCVDKVLKYECEDNP